MLEIEPVCFELAFAMSAAAVLVSQQKLPHLIVGHWVLPLGISVISPAVLVAEVEDGRGRGHSICGLVISEGGVAKGRVPLVALSQHLSAGKLKEPNSGTLGRTSISSDGPELLASSAVDSSCISAFSLVSSGLFDDAIANMSEGTGHLSPLPLASQSRALKDWQYPALWYPSVDARRCVR
jgi:hypothetical protein